MDKEDTTTLFFNSLSTDWKDKLRIVEIFSPQDILVSSNSDWNAYGISNSDVEVIKKKAASFIYPCSENIINCIRSDKWSKISFGCKALDDCTDGGILTRGITEICGESGSGKTQILLQLSLIVQLPAALGGLEGKTIYINTECRFPIKRLDQLILKNPIIAQADNKIQFTESIFIKHIFEGDDVLKCIKYQISQLVKVHKIKLIIIDSIAGCFRTETNYMKRANTLREIVNELLKIIDLYGCSVVVSNQMTQVENTLIPCLGLAWSNLIQTRFELSKMKLLDVAVPNKRNFKVLLSSSLPMNECNFFITEQGIADSP